MDSQTWDGITRGATLKDGPERQRHQLADLAKRYEWDAVLAFLAEHRDLVNVTRPDGESWYAALHQAAHGGAPAQVAERLIELGAWRLLPTATRERPFEIARRRGHAHLLGPLEPRPVIDVPAEKLAEIQRHFHEVIRGHAAGLIDQNGLRLPELAVLTESEPPAAYFAVPGMYGGFHYRLCQAETGWLLTSASWSRIVGGSGRRYEISAAGAQLVDEGFV